MANRDIQDIDPKYLAGGEYSLVATRFDRGENGLRVHMEDFAQVVGSIHDLKYVANQSMLVKMVVRFVPGRGQALQAVRRLVSDIMVGNSDSHLKNWSFIFPDGVNGELSPAYDITPMFYYGDDEMGLDFGGSKNPAIVGSKRFERLAGHAGIEQSAVEREVRHTVEQILDVWPGMLPNLPMPPEFQERLLTRWQSLTLTKQIRPQMIPGFSVASEDAPATTAMKP